MDNAARVLLIGYGYVAKSLAARLIARGVAVTATTRSVDTAEAIARAGSIRKAAEALAITSTALNRRVLALALSATLNAPIPQPRFGVFRM